ncbi:hypothetical protein HWV62_7547 [Athelia sp. TMB]|nr:hypothetical protein HWV62_7547 [Athelia sp. TMB]
MELFKRTHPRRPPVSSSPKLTDEYWVLVKTCWGQERHPETRPSAEGKIMQFITRTLHSATRLPAAVARPTSRLVHTTPALLKESSSHTADHYSKDVDSTPPSGTVHRVDSSADSAQHAHEAAYKHTDSEYTSPGGREEEKGSYGATTDAKSRKQGGSGDKSGEGPNSGDAGGRQ